MRVLLNVIGMAVFGAAALLCVGFLFEARSVWRANAVLAQQLEPGHTAAGTTGELRRSPDLGPIVQAIAGHLDAAANALEAGVHTAATPRLDASLRLARVLRDVTRKDEAVRAVEQARRALQNDRARDAARLARVAARTVAGLRDDSPRRPRAVTSYRGATVLDVIGQRVGTVVEADRARLTIEEGGLRNLLGFVTLQHGILRRVPADAVIFGAPHRVGETLVIDTTGGA